MPNMVAITNEHLLVYMLKDYGVLFFDNNGRFRTPQQVLTDVAKIWNIMSAEDQSFFWTYFQPHLIKKEV